MQNRPAFASNNFAFFTTTFFQISVEKKVKQIPLLAVALILALGILNLLLIQQNLSLRKQLKAGGKIEATGNVLNPAK